MKLRNMLAASKLGNTFIFVEEMFFEQKNSICEKYLG